MSTEQLRAQWDARTHGGVAGHWIFYQVLRLLGPAPAYLLLYPVAAYFTLKARSERQASMQYLDRVLGPARGLRRWWRTYRHFLAYARAYLEGAMLGILGRDVFETEHVGVEHMRAMGASKAGGVLVTAHLGNWEMSSGLLKDVHGLGNVVLVMFRSDAEELQRFVESVHSKRPRVIAVGEGDLAALDILRAVRGGELVAMQGDRTVDVRDVKVPFFGHEARWPVGPWVIAALTGAPVLWGFAVRLGRRHYRFIADPPRTLRFDPSRPKDEQLREWVRAYVARVEEVLREHPYQWFNFFDFWAAEPKTPAKPAGSPLS